MPRGSRPKQDLISAQTRTAFREAFVELEVLRTIRDYFDGAGIAHATLPPERQVPGERRSLVEEYYATVDWRDWTSVRLVLEAYEHFLLDLESRTTASWSSGTSDALKATFDKLLRLLGRDGVRWSDGRLLATHDVRSVTVHVAASAHFDSAVLREHLGRIEASVETDPAQAVGASKELVESVAKMVLERYGEPVEKAREQLPQLVGRAFDALNIRADSVEGDGPVAASSRKILGSLLGVTQGMAEIRNAFGTGHGRSSRRPIQPRHAMLMVGAAATLCRFMMATFEARVGAGAGPSQSGGTPTPDGT